MEEGGYILPKYVYNISRPETAKKYTIAKLTSVAKAERQYVTKYGEIKTEMISGKEHRLRTQREKRKKKRDIDESSRIFKERMDKLSKDWLDREDYLDYYKKKYGETKKEQDESLKKQALEEEMQTDKLKENLKEAIYNTIAGFEDSNMSWKFREIFSEALQDDEDAVLGRLDDMSGDAIGTLQELAEWHYKSGDTASEVYQFWYQALRGEITGEQLRALGDSISDG